MSSKFKIVIFFALTFICFLEIATAKRLPNSELILNGSTCVRTEDCSGSDVFCNENKQCECQFGYSLRTLDTASNYQVCFPKNCFDDHDRQCSALYGPNTGCKYGRCACQPSFKYNQDNRECQLNPPETKALFESCTKASSVSMKSDCGEGAICAGGYCRCPVGHNEVNRYSCEFFGCYEDSECEKLTLHSTCIRKDNSSAGFCFCSGNYTFGETYTSCVRRGEDLGDQCRTIEDCGSGTNCVQGRCQCSNGHVPSTNNTIDCHPIKCRSDLDCSSHDLNSVCNDKSECVCMKGCYADPWTETCVKLQPEVDEPESNNKKTLLKLLNNLEPLEENLKTAISGYKQHNYTAFAQIANGSLLHTQWAIQTIAKLPENTTIDVRNPNIESFILFQTVVYKYLYPVLADPVQLSDVIKVNALIYGMTKKNNSSSNDISKSNLTLNLEEAKETIKKIITEENKIKYNFNETNSVLDDLYNDLYDKIGKPDLFLMFPPQGLIERRISHQQKYCSTNSCTRDYVATQTKLETLIQTLYTEHPINSNMKLDTVSNVLKELYEVAIQLDKLQESELIECDEFKCSKKVEKQKS